MMISPEAFYEMELKGKSVPELRATLFRLRTEIGRMHSIMEGKFAPEMMIHPSPLVQLVCTRQYFDITVEALKEQGFIYKPTSAEKRVKELYEAIEHVKSITFHMGGFHQGYIKRELTIDPQTKIVTINAAEKTEDESDEKIYALMQLYLPEWKREYMDHDILDGTQWELKVAFDGDVKPLVCTGSNAYPYNFNELLELLEIEKGE